jgi:hypothetical protein
MNKILSEKPKILRLYFVIRSYRIIKIWWWKQRKLWTDIFDWNRENEYW